jgi:uncharacterized coiled-coil protein SlyX
MDPELNERLTRIESSLAHVEHLCEQLSQVIMEQGREISRVTAHQQKVAQTVEAMELERVKATNSKPPHYQ